MSVALRKSSEAIGPTGGVPLMEHARGGAESLKLHDSEIRHGPSQSKGWRLRVRERYVTVAKQFRSSAFEVYLSVTELRLLDAPATLNGRRQDASTLQVLKSVPVNRNAFPERTKPTITVIHSRSQEAQVYADFCQRLSRVRQHIILATDSGRHAVATGAHARHPYGECRRHCADSRRRK